MPQLGGNARAGSGWLVVEGDESDRSVAALRPEIAVLLNVDLDHHTTFVSRAEVESFFEEWLREVPHVVRAEELEPATLELRVPGEHNRRNAAAALAALELAGVPAQKPRRRSSSFAAPARRLEQKGEAGGVAVLDSYAHHPAELAADLAAVRNGGRPPRALPAAPLLAHAPPRARLRRGARRRGCRVRHRDLPALARSLCPA